jgi:hypothetical protein
VKAVLAKVVLAKDAPKSALASPVAKLKVATATASAVTALKPPRT